LLHTSSDDLSVSPQGEGSIYYLDNGNPVTDDTTKYALVVLLLTLAFAEALIALIAAVICVCFKPKQEQRVSSYENALFMSK